MDRIVGIGECAVSNKKEDVIKIFALASCVAVTAYCPSIKAAGMIHVALPAPFDNDDRVSRPCHFATTGIPLFIDKMAKKYGCIKENLIIGVYGGANSVKNNDMFSIGKRNIDAVRNTLKWLNLKINSIEVGGTISRTLEMSVETGTVKISTYPIKI